MASLAPSAAAGRKLALGKTSLAGDVLEQLAEDDDVGGDAAHMLGQNVCHGSGYMSQGEVWARRWGGGEERGGGCSMSHGATTMSGVFDFVTAQWRKKIPTPTTTLHEKCCVSPSGSGEN